MKNRRLSQTMIKSLFAVFLLLAMLCRYVGRNGILPLEMAIIRGVIQCGLLVAWGVSLINRIINKRVLRLFLALAGLMFLWVVLRTCKYSIPDSWAGWDTLQRSLWYAYYVPIEFIPLLGVYAAEYVNRPDNYRMPKKHWLLAVPSAGLCGLIFTNDLHEFAFVNPHLGNVGQYRHGPVYYLAVVWVYVLAGIFVGILLKKSRLSKTNRIVLPFVPILLAILYTVLYLLAFDLIQSLLGDLVPVLCFLVVMLVEICLKTGLIGSNTHYDEIFRESSLYVQIADDDYQIYLSSKKAKPIEKAIMQEAEMGSVMLSNNIRLSSKKIKGGHVLWTENMAELAGVIGSMEDLNEHLQDRYAVLTEEYNTRRSRQSLVEKNRLYNLTQTITKTKVDRLSEIARSLLRTENEKELADLAVEAAVLCAYVKRRNNLLFIAEENRQIPTTELIYCLKESLSNMEFSGMTTAFHSNLHGMSTIETLSQVYDQFELIAERAMFHANALFVSIANTEEEIILSVNIQDTQEYTDFSKRSFMVCRDDENEWTLAYRIAPIKKEGVAM